MPKYVLTGVDGHLGGIAASYAVQIAKPDEKLVFTTYQLDTIPADKLAEWKSKGAEVQVATYDDPESLKRVFAGAEAVTLISTWLFGEGRRRQARNVVEAAKATGVKRVCYTSFVGAGIQAERDEDIPFLPRDHHYIEGVVTGSGLQYSIQRNYLYMDNIPALFAQSWKFCGDRWLNNSHGQKGAYVAREDAGRVAAALLLGRGEPNTIYDVTGPEAVTDREVFDWINSQSGYKAQFVDTPDEELKKWWLDRGLPESFEGDFSALPMKLCIGDLLCCGEMVARGFMAQTSDTVEKLTGRKPLGYKEALLEYKDIFPRSE
ncbi:Quinone oxidoreductase 2 [Pleurostoma richardsiae]|uniref:Quinone oxidoreductase 2 n=1 Tax=Pleurostoma richardsiae TaxID=41990 RepID=A0AA38RG45_9PEZI|nr:Quinone oxidoreductase 2 [Pleurostoma richardsiae]